MSAVPFFSTILITTGFIDAPTATIGTMLVNLGLLFWIRKNFKTGLSSLFGGKIKFQCLACQGNKFDGKGTCYRCGSKAKKSV